LADAAATAVSVSIKVVLLLIAISCIQISLTVFSFFWIFEFYSFNMEIQIKYVSLLLKQRRPERTWWYAFQLGSFSQKLGNWWMEFFSPLCVCVLVGDLV